MVPQPIPPEVLVTQPLLSIGIDVAGLATAEWWGIDLGMGVGCGWVPLGGGFGFTIVVTDYIIRRTFSRSYVVLI